ncbi:hypothetical protein Pelo_18219 [Pelomyxa schiedti]|nr:hypothetical protein Pelo_18219 [Pelomyxa schiedti]
MFLCHDNENYNVPLMPRGESYRTGRPTPSSGKPSIKASMTTTTTTPKGEGVGRLLMMSRVVWDHVVPVLVPRPARRVDGGGGWHHPPTTRGDCVAVMRVAEAMFPLVPRACHAVLGTLWWRRLSSYFALDCAADAGGADGERGRCASWLLLRRHGEAAGGGRGGGGRNEEREARLVDGGEEAERSGRRMWWEDCGIKWLGGAGDLENDNDFMVRDLVYDTEVEDTSTLLCCVCKEGHLDVAKWIITRFGVKEWELGKPIIAALKGGHLGVAQWLAWRFDMRLASRVLSYGYQFAGQSRNLEVMKWCDDVFALTEEDADYKGLLSGESTAEEQIEGCKWFSNKFPEWKLDTESTQVYHQKTLRWLIESGLVMPDTNFCLWCAYNSICDANLIEWLIDSFNVPLPECFYDVFQNQKDSVEVVKVMIQRANTVSVIDNSIMNALSVGNFAVADWLEDTYHLTQTGGVKSLTLSCATHYTEGPEALKWFLDRVPHVELIEQHEVTESILECLKLDNIRGALYLLETFHLPHDTNTATMWKEVLGCLPRSDLASAQKMAALGQFSQSEVAESLQAELECSSSKVVKWLIESFNLTRDQVTQNNNQILYVLIIASRASCAEWIITKFHVTFHEVMDMVKKRYNSWHSVSLRTWRMLLRQFPEITADVVRDTESFLYIVAASPLNIEFSVSKLGLTKREMVRFYKTARTVGTETPLWFAITKRDACL